MSSTALPNHTKESNESLLSKIPLELSDRIAAAIAIAGNTEAYQKIVAEITMMYRRLKELEKCIDKIGTQEIQEFVMLQAKLREAAQRIEEREAALNAKEEEVKTREETAESALAAVTERENEAARRTRLADDIIEFYREKNGISEDVPDFKITTEKYFVDKLQDLQEKMKTLLSTYTSDVEMTPEDMDIIKNQIMELKVRFLVTVMMYSETIPSNEVLTCQIGDSKKSLDIVLRALPKALGIMEERKFEGSHQKKDKEYWLVAYTYELGYYMKKKLVYTFNDEYNTQLEDLIKLGIIEPKGEKTSKRKIKADRLVERLLKRYCNMGLDCTDKSKDEIYNVKRTQNPSVKTIVQETPVTKILPEVKKLMEEAGRENDER